MSKLTKEELTEVQGLKQKLDAIQLELGRLELVKGDLLNSFAAVAAKLEEAKGKLNEKYGNVSIDLTNGSYEEVKEEKE